MIATRCVKANLTLVRKLLEIGADVNVKSGNSDTAHLRAYQYGHLKIVRLLLDSGADVNTRTGTGGTPLNIAEAQHYLNTVEMPKTI